LQDDDQAIQNDNLVNDDVANQLADLSAQPNPPAPDPAAQAPGQQFTPDPTAQPPVTDESSAIGSDLPDLSPPATEPTQAVDEQPAAFEPPVPETTDETTPVLEDQLTQAVENLADTPQGPESTEDTKSFKVEGESVADTAPEPIGEEEHVEEPSELEGVKKKALSELKPLVDKVDLSPEKRYDLLMEIIQASDDKALVQQAYDAAHDITDDDLRAQALLEIINEIEYLEGDKKV